MSLAFGHAIADQFYSNCIRQEDGNQRQYMCTKLDPDLKVSAVFMYRVAQKKRHIWVFLALV